MPGNRRPRLISAPWRGLVHLGRIQLLMAAVLAASLAACAGPARARTLTIGISQFPSTFHPSIDAMAAKSYILDMARRPLTTFGHDWKLECMLCTALPSLAKGTARLVTRADGSQAVDATFTIRPDASWGDGVPITTKDVMFTWEVGRNPASGVTNAGLFNRDIAGITPVDDKTFIVHWAKYFCSYDAINDFELLPAHLEQKLFEADPAGYHLRTLYDTDTTNPGLYFGPYRIAAVEGGSSVTLERNPHWWGPAPFFDRIVVRAIENTAALETNLLSGDIDMIAGEVGITLDQALAFEQRHHDRFRVLYQTGLFYEHIDLNLGDPVLADQRVRQALLLAIDRQAISRQLFAGKQPVADNFVHPLDSVHVAGYPVYRHDPEAAGHLLAAAGWSTVGGDGIRRDQAGHRLSLTLSTTAGNRTRELVEQVLQSQWRQVGIDVRLDNQPARILFGQTLRERKFPQMAMYAWLSPPDNVPRTTLHSSMIPSAANGYSGQNFPGLRNAEMDQLIDRLETNCAPADQEALWGKVETLYVQQLPALPLYYRADPYILPTWLTGVRPTGHLTPSTAWVEQWRAGP